jgi:Flp pilus assembly pilin Flp
MSQGMNHVNVRQSTGGRVGLLRRFIHDDGGQDVIEYAFLAVAIGVVGWLVLDGIRADATDAYTSWIDPTVGTPSLWEPAEPPTP